jgi:hypothetical protein
VKRLAAICVLAAASSALAVPVTAQESHPRAATALDAAKRAVAQPSAGQAPEELTPALIRLSQALPRLEGADRRIANRILARPDDGRDDRYGDGFTVDEADESPTCDPRFCVHWVGRSKDAPKLRDSDGTSDGDGVPDFVEQVLAAADHSFNVENTGLGWTDPVGDGPRGGGTGNNKTDIYLLELNGNYFGYSSPDEGQGPILHKQAYLVLDNNYREFRTRRLSSVQALQVTLAHEYNHVLQFAYDSHQDLWMFEATATWMENQVYGDIDDYLHYVPAFARNSRVPLTGNDIQGLKIYGAAVWNHYLAETESPDLIRDAWAKSDEIDPPSLSVAAYDSALGGGANQVFRRLGTTFIRFAATSAEWRLSDAFPDHAAQPDVRRSGKLVLDRARIVRLDHLAYVLANIRPRLARRDLELRVRAPADTRTGLALLGRRGTATAGNVESTSTVLPIGGKGRVRLNGDDYDRVTAVIVNGDARVGNRGRYTRDDQRFRFKLVRAG